MRGLAIESRPWIRAGIAPPAGELFKNTGGTTQTLTLSGFGQLGNRSIVLVYDALAFGATEEMCSLGNLNATGKVQYNNTINDAWYGLVNTSAGGTTGGMRPAGSGTLGQRHASLVTADVGAGSATTASIGTTPVSASFPTGNGFEDAPKLTLNGINSNRKPLYVAAFRRAFNTDAERDAAMREALRIVIQRGL